MSVSIDQYAIERPIVGTKGAKRDDKRLPIRLRMVATTTASHSAQIEVAWMGSSKYQTRPWGRHDTVDEWRWWAHVFIRIGMPQSSNYSFLL